MTALVPTPVQWPSEDLWAQLHTRLNGFTVEVLAQIDSTNEELMRRARQGDTAPVLLVAEEQTAGRGRRGRPWLSTPGQSLTASLGLALAPQDWSGLSLVVGLALAEALHPDIRLKWPNDLVWRGAKLGGILVETATMADGGSALATAAGQGSRPVAPRYAVLGFGLNIVAPASPLPAQTGAPAPHAASGLQELGLGWTAPQALAAVVPALVDSLQRFEDQGFAAFVERFHARDALRGQPVAIWSGGEGGAPAYQGVALGVSPDGALRVRDASGVQHLEQHGEVSVRPVAQAVAAQEPAAPTTTGTGA
jgi:BirA family transcriptional regulator, biotin operon repressor / biotin---[acetyl-CoA-carboxylase] ligase